MSFATLLSEATASPTLPSTGDVLAVGLPLLHQLAAFHAEGLVSRLDGVAHLEYVDGALRIAPGATRPPRLDPRVEKCNPERSERGVEILQRLAVDHGDGMERGHAITSLDVSDGTAPPDRPMLVVGYRAWEQMLDHHDALTDVHLAGLVLTSYATGLDLDHVDHVHRLALSRRHLLALVPSLHPVVAGVLTDMINPDRHRRPGDLYSTIALLEHHRELPADLDLTDAYEAPGDWRPAVLAALRERVFDTSRRNRALYFKPTASSVSLTEASVPLLLDTDRINAADLLTWNDRVAAEFTAGKPVDIERWCRFEEAPYLASTLDSIIASERRLRAEHGQGALRLIVAFLRWVDPETGESVNSPLLTMPAQLSSQRGVRHRYRVACDTSADATAEVNPVLRHVFERRFNIMLTTHLEPTPTAIAEFTTNLEAAVRATDPSIRIELVTTPRINLIRRSAQLRVDSYLRRRARALAASGRWRRQAHSYDLDDWRPLGAELYRAYLAPIELPLQLVAGAAPVLRPPPAFAAPARQRDEFSVQQSSDRHRWEVDLCAVTIASLGGRRISLARDYDAAISAFEKGDSVPAGTLASFETIFAPRPRVLDHPPLHGIEVEQPLVLPADDSQARAVRRAVAEESFIIQGPPGTGKSQTIANLIAALVAENKRVLFVCEKRAAIDVVAHRLDQAGLGELVVTIHDSQLDRKAFIAELGETYSGWMSDIDDDREQRRDDALAAVRELLDPLEAEFVEFGDDRGGRVSVTTLVQRLVTHRAAGVEAALNVPIGVDASAWLTSRPALDRVLTARPAAEAMSALGAIPSLRVRPRSLGHPDVVGEPNASQRHDPVVTVRHIGSALGAAMNRLTELCEAVPPTGDSGLLDRMTVADLLGIAPDLALLTRLATHAGRTMFDPEGDARQELRNSVAAIHAATAVAHERSAVASRWVAVLDSRDAREALSVATDKEGSLFKMFSGRWREVKSLVERSYRFADHQVRPTVASVLTELVGMHDANESLAGLRATAQARFGTDAAAGAIAALERLDGNPLVDVFRQQASAANWLDALPVACGAVVAGTHSIIVASAVPVSALTHLARGLEATPVSHERMLLAWSALNDAPAAVLDAALDPSSTIDQVELAILTEALQRAGTTDGGRYAGERLDVITEQLLARHRELLVANAGMVAARARTRFRDHVTFAESSMAGRSDADKEFKRAYNAGRRLLEREFQKKMRHRTIRELAGGESGLVVSDLKPVWMMSPLSVSDTLPLDVDGTSSTSGGSVGRFDVVVFDEASQIPVEDAVPTLLRSPQSIVVGDRMQLPPTRFFAGAHDLDDEVVVDVDGHPQSVALDADSFLGQADLALPSALLSWHYRSRSEALIAYSNHAFYGARLATIPDRSLPGDERPEIVVHAASDAQTFANSVLDRPISFHRVTSGVYTDRRNDAEADYIAELIRALLHHPDRRTIGIVAFSEAQQSSIETALTELANIDPEFAEQLAAEEERVDDGEFVGLFVKNLENVQGDERDIIVMSVCYARDAAGRMRMNFGPINQSGGERRLNVIFSRAKRHMAIVSSIDGAAITNIHNDGAAHLARFLTFAAAESRRDGAGTSVTKALLTSPRPPVVSAAGTIADQIADALRTKGHTVDTGVGRSEFTIDVAVRAAGGDGYSLGVLVEPGGGDATATARLVAEAGVLDAAGWNITRVLAVEWWFNPDHVLARLDAAAKG
ncbi:MAG TPA: AAA domain-containing protein [Ilumatobacter sp.]|nr:AAA domain-containing protein [Ilumatobacter sp.]